MKKLSKEELIGWLDTWIYKSLLKQPEEKQAYKQIRKLIEEKPEETFRRIFKKYPKETQKLLTKINDIILELGVKKGGLNE